MEKLNVFLIIFITVALIGSYFAYQHSSEKEVLKSLEKTNKVVKKQNENIADLEKESVQKEVWGSLPDVSVFKEANAPKDDIQKIQRSFSNIEEDKTQQISLRVFENIKEHRQHIKNLSQIFPEDTEEIRSLKKKLQEKKIVLEAAKLTPLELVNYINVLSNVNVKIDSSSETQEILEKFVIDIHPIPMTAESLLESLLYVGKLDYYFKESKIFITKAKFKEK